MTTLVRRVEDRDGHVVRGLWRKLRTLVLKRGTVSPSVHRPSLSFILKRAAASAVEASLQARKRGGDGETITSVKRIKLSTPSESGDDDESAP